MKKVLMIGICLCLMLACAACQSAEQNPTQMPSDRSAVESTREAAGSPSGLNGTQPNATAAEIQNTPS